MPTVVVLPPAFYDWWAENAALFLSPDERAALQTTQGGLTRSESVRNALRVCAQIGAPRALVAVHDAARPLTPLTCIEAAFDAAEKTGAAVCAMPIRFSLRRVDRDGVTFAVPREDYLEVQTPQVFRLEVLQDAFAARPDEEFTDEATRVEAAGFCVTTVPGADVNLKLTTPVDFALASLLISREAGA